MEELCRRVADLSHNIEVANRQGSHGKIIVRYVQVFLDLAKPRREHMQGHIGHGNEDNLIDLLLINTIRCPSKSRYGAASVSK